MISINRELITEKLEKFNPLTEEYKNYWKVIKRKCIEGYWIGNTYIPATIYFYRNIWNIKLNKENSKSKTIGNPHVRDIEWLRAYLYMEARGFSGFELDTEFHCNHLLLEKQLLKTSNDTRKFVTPEEYLNRVFTRPLGKPLYENPSKNILDLECRDSGKSYWVAALCGMNFLFDGALDYDEYLTALFLKKPMSSETMIGAIDAFYSNQTCNKLLLGLDNLEGSQDYQDVFYPSPLAKFYDGSLVPSKFIIAKRKVKVKENWTVKGSKSMVHHRTFFGNELAGNSIRPSLAVLDEVGFMDNLTHALGHLKDSTSAGGIKTGTIYMIGTGGDSKGKGTAEITKVFNNPQEYDCVSREDLYENRGRRCFFIPKILAYDSNFRDENGFTIIEKAQKKWDNDYTEAKKSTNIDTLNSFYQNSPLTPSHALLSLEGNKYPSAQLHEQLGYLESLPKKELNQLAIKGYLDCDEYGIVTFKPDLDNNLRDCDYPIKSNNKKGCITIYKLPQDTTWLNYIGGLDPIAKEGDPSQIQSDSVASLIIMSRGMLGNEIVAEYTGREDDLNDTNEIMRRLIIFYNAFTLYENNYNNFKVYLQSKNQLHYLAKTPNVLKAGVGRADQFGLHATKDGNEEMSKYTRDWLLEKNFTGEINIKSINSIGMLKELLASGDGVNTDRESALKLCIVLKLQLSLNIKKETVKSDYFKFFERRYDKQGNLINR